MSNITLCERRTTCALNDNGKCTLNEPRIDTRAAYVSCLDQVLGRDTMQALHKSTNSFLNSSNSKTIGKSKFDSEKKEFVFNKKEK